MVQDMQNQNCRLHFEEQATDCWLGRRTGVGVNTLNLEVVSLDEVSRTISKSAGFVIGSPTLGGHMPTQVNPPLSPLLCNPEPESLKSFWHSHSA